MRMHGGASVQAILHLRSMFPYAIYLDFYSSTITYKFLCQCSSAQKGTSYSLAGVGLLAYQLDQLRCIERRDPEFFTGENIICDTTDILRRRIKYVG